ncbi:MAG TPA: RHS repeat-associated core domain-containing protein [Chloroflexi bacterium]|nr:RHS repeat-associated core domain-containing protein [Chloroflexota bacterium]
MHTFTGQPLDPDAGLMYYQARWYDPRLGRFVQADTVVPRAGEPQALNRYAYALNSPLKHIDSNGHCSFNILTGELNCPGPTTLTVDVSVSGAPTSLQPLPPAPILTTDHTEEDAGVLLVYEVPGHLQRQQKQRSVQ